MRIAIYVRKSIEVKDSVSIQTQIDMCKNYFMDSENEFEVFSDDGFTGSNVNRPDFQKLNKKIQLKCFDTLVCYKLDRISRKVLDIADFFEVLEKNNVAFICVKDHYDTTTPMGRAMLYFASVFAQLERETTAERVKDAMLNLAKSGCWTGGRIPYGYKLTKHNGKSYLELDNEELIQDCFNLYLEKGFDPAHKEIKSKHNINMGNNTYWRILRSPMYAKSSNSINDYLISRGWGIVGNPNDNGYLVYGVSVNESMAIISKHKAVIDSNIWLKVQNSMDSNRENNTKNLSQVYWLSGILKCNSCKSNYIATSGKAGRYYACSNRLRRHNKQVEKCKNYKYIKADKIESEIEDFIINLKNKNAFDKSYDKQKNDKVLISDVDKLESKLEKNRKTISNLIDKLELLSNSAAAPFIEKIEKLTNENKNLEIQIEDKKLTSMIIDKDKFNREFIYENVYKFSKELEPGEKRIRIKNIFKSLTYDPVNDELTVEWL